MLISLYFNFLVDIFRCSRSRRHLSMFAFCRTPRLDGSNRSYPDARALSAQIGGGNTSRKVENAVNVEIKSALPIFTAVNALSRSKM